MQMATALTQIVMNRPRVGRAVTKYGSEIALSCYSIMMKIYQVAHAMFVGVASGTQPINGYNFGAKQARQGETDLPCGGDGIFHHRISLWFGIFQLGGGFMAGLFVKNEPLYLNLRCSASAVYMLGFFVYGLPQVTASFFQAIGSPQNPCWWHCPDRLSSDSSGADLSGRFGLTGVIGCGTHCRCAGVSAGGSVLIWTEFGSGRKTVWHNWVGICFL